MEVLKERERLRYEIDERFEFEIYLWWEVILVHIFVIIL